MLAMLPTADSRRVQLPLISEEVEWRNPPGIIGLAARPKVVVSRWIDPAVPNRFLRSNAPAGYYVITITLRSTDLSLSVGDRPVHSGQIPPGTILLSAPEDAVSALFRAPVDALHIFVDRDFMQECRSTAASDVREDPPLASSQFFRDPALERLGHSLLEAENRTGAFEQFYAEGIVLAIIMRLLALQSGISTRTKAAPLAPWRLTRAIELMDDNLSGAVTLCELAASAGLTRMHFAAQFRAATGLRPHEFYLRRRIEHAQQLLSTTPAPLVDVAMNVGFKTQTHFTCVFKRFVGETPSRWRSANYKGPSNTQKKPATATQSVGRQ